jgi:hypothetical protein
MILKKKLNGYKPIYNNISLKQFYGIIAQTSHCESTKYMSMWIEEKNKSNDMVFWFDLMFMMDYKLS